jgi:NADH-quinone oxidoreductase subunit L
VIGIITALLTAFYMTRQVIMVFFGEARWESKAEEHGAHGDLKPHESSPIMTIPLVILGIMSLIAGLVQLPSFTWIPGRLQHRLEHWLEPVVEYAEADISGTWAAGHLYLLIGIATACAALGIVLAWLVYQRKRLQPFEPTILRRGWYYDREITRFMGGPGRKAFDAIAWFDRSVVDAAVNGAARVVTGASGELRKGQTGNVRNYAGIVGIGVVLLLVWFVVVRGVL